MGEIEVRSEWLVSNIIAAVAAPFSVKRAREMFAEVISAELDGSY